VGYWVKQVRFGGDNRDNWFIGVGIVSVIPIKIFGGKMQIIKLKKEDILVQDFNPLEKNNEIDFSTQGIAVVYGPNGTGKTTFLQILGREDKTEYEINYDGTLYSTSSETNLFHTIKDQNGRNIIEGETQDFILGDNIRKEYELKSFLEDGFKNLFETNLSQKLKSEFKISTKQSDFHSKISNAKIIEYITYLANVRSKGKDIDRDEFIEEIKKIQTIEIDEHDENKLLYLVNDYSSKASLIKKIESLSNGQIKRNPDIKKIDETDDAVAILNKYDYLDDCLICERSINRELLISEKEEKKKRIIESIDPETKKLLEEIIKKSAGDDPFQINEKLKLAIIEGDFSHVKMIQDEINDYFKIYDKKINNLFSTCLDDTEIEEKSKEYNKLAKEKQIFTHEDAMFIESFINDSLNRKIELKRDSNGNLDLLLGDEKFLNKERTKLGLSNGEQNFISLSFELLKAQKIDNPIIILDDPISSFDSIYKNKIAYAIIKFLSEKKQIILSHSLDLIRLLEHQQPKSYKLYIMNNTDGEENGFLKLSEDEHGLLLYLNKVLDLLRDDIKSFIRDEKKFIISIIPFLRGYAQIISNNEVKEKFNKLMHGYNNERVIISGVYKELLGNDICTEDIEITSKDIINEKIEDISKFQILDSSKFPLLNKTLIHTFTYLQLRLTVEETLVNKFSINTRKHDMLSQIIRKAYPEDGTQENTRKRIFLLSRKSLLNEFNHFEIDMNIFQPAIDITNSTLNKERDDILKFINDEKKGTV